MALRTKSIQYAMYSATESRASAVARGFNRLQIFVPETGSRRFTSCFVTYFTADTGSAASPTVMRLQAGATASATATVTMDTTGEGAAITSTLTNSGESMSWFLSRDVTTVISGAFGPNSQSAYFELTSSVTSTITAQGSAKLTLTYEYDDVASTRIKTVRIPFQSSTGSMTTSYLQHGAANQIPALDTFLPEANKVYRDIFFEIQGNDSNAGGAAGVLFVSASSGTELTASNQLYIGLTSARHYYYIAKMTNLLTSAASPWTMKTTNVAGSPFTCLSTILHVTYEYNATASTSVMNSIMLVGADDSGYSGGPVSPSASRFNRDVIIDEPGPIQLVQSGVTFFYASSAATAFHPMVGNQADFTFAIPAPVMCGGNALTVRIDGGSPQGAAFASTSFGRGKNTLNIDWYRTGTTVGTLGGNVCALVYLNYTSSISSQAGGDANHAHTEFQHFMSHAALGPLFSVYNWVPYMTSSLWDRYWLMSYGFVLYSVISTDSTVATGQAVTLTAQIMPPEQGGRGWETLYSSFYETDVETASVVNVCRATDSFKRNRNDPSSDGLNFTQSREMRVSFPVRSFVNGYAFYTYHTINYEVSGAISGYSGDGSGINVYLYQSGSSTYDKEVKRLTTAAGGKFSTIWHNNTIPLYAVAWQDGTHMGRSSYYTASGNS